MSDKYIYQMYISDKIYQKPTILHHLLALLPLAQATSEWTNWIQPKYPPTGKELIVDIHST